MPLWLTDAFPGDAEPLVSQILVRLVAAILLGSGVAAIYRGTRRDRTAGPDLAQTLLLLTLVIAMITLAVGGNVARAFSLVGALAIVRFRMVVNDPRDTAFVILAVAVGLAVGAGFLAVPLVGLPLAAAVAWTFTVGASPPTAGRVCDVAVMLDTVTDASAPDLLLAECLDGVRPRRIESPTKTAGTEFTYHGMLKPGVDARDLARRLAQITGVTAVDIRLGEASRS